MTISRNLDPAARSASQPSYGTTLWNAIYFKTDRLPVLFLLYVAITALTRFLAIDVKDLSLESVLAVTGSIFVLTLAVLVVQIATSRFSTSAPNARSPSAIDSSEANTD